MTASAGFSVAPIPFRGGVGTFGVLSTMEIAGTYTAFFNLPAISRSDVEASSSLVFTDLSIPTGAVVTRAVVELTADAPGTTPIGGIATVRAAAGQPESSSTKLVVDFKTLRTVSALAAPAAIVSITPWAGTKFDKEVPSMLKSPSGMEASFTELQTERLLVELSTSKSPATFAAEGLVTTTTPPADLELLVGDVRVWFRPGPVPTGFTESVDITDGVQAVVDAGGVVLDEDGNLPVRVALSARVPGDLDLALPPDEPRFLRTLTVAFPAPTAPVGFTEEGVSPLLLPLPDGSDSWVIHRVLATVAADDPGPLRVLPNVGPAISNEADMLLDPNRRLVAKLPAGPLGRFDQLAGVRLLVAPGDGGIEVGGALLGGTADDPGDPFPDGALTPVTLDAGSAGWVTLALARPVKLAPLLEPGGAVWVSIAVTRGTAQLALANPAASPEGDLTVLRQVAPNGLARRPSTVFGFRPRPDGPPRLIRTDALALRVIGVAPDRSPIPVVEVDVPGGPTARTAGLGGTTSISLDPVGPRRQLTLQLSATAATNVTVGPVVVAYTEGPALRRKSRLGRTE